MGQRAGQNRKRTEELPKLPRGSYFSMAGLYGCSVPDMHSPRLIAMSVTMLCYLLLCPVDGTSPREPTTVISTMLPSSKLGYQMPTSDLLSCQVLLPQSLPGFSQMPPVSKFLVGLALRTALEEAGCQADARALQLQLYRLGGVEATQALTHHLQELQNGGHTDWKVSVDALSSALQRSAWKQPGPKRARRWISNTDCENEQEQSVHNVVDQLPGVGTYYNLGTALYYAFKNCSDKAKERGRDGAIDLGYDLLMAMVGASGGPAGAVITAALRPAMKMGVQRLIQYYYDEKEGITPQPEVTTPQPETGKDTTIYSSDVEETTMPNFVSGVESTSSIWVWPLLKNYGVLAYKR
ncbi:apolipoprotein F [Apodemus sylvaticus]|uniref:apolipoprotein F n=1 Tax=Apodemus sylvaticus TaxID=10129 RepID=UPI00224464BA|nr:apolipoprotein F [Apodemus sylvaticus]